MIPLSLACIAQAVGGQLCNAADPTLKLTTVSDDSRKVAKGSLFIALRGERFDAHDYLAHVAADGAACAVVDRPEKAASAFRSPLSALPFITVPDTRKALGQLGHHARQQFKTTVIAIGGSNGKTTTKHLVGSVLASTLTGTQSPKSFNNDIGVPLTLLGVSPGDDYVVLELGTNHPGELSPLSHMSCPQIAAITSIGPEHLEGFGDLDGVRREELCLLDGLERNGLVIANADDEPLPNLVRQRARRVITFGFARDCDLRIDAVEGTLEDIRFRIAGEPDDFRLPLPGRHNAANALVAIAIGRELGISSAAIRDSLANCTRPEMRMQVQRAGQHTILNDAYNANPASMAAALQTLAQARVPHRRIAVLGEMRELGPATAAMHRQVGRLAGESNLAALIAVGPAARDIADAAIDAGMPKSCVHWVSDSAAAASLVPTLLEPDDTILLKASRTVKLEAVAQALASSSLKSDSPPISKPS